MRLDHVPALKALRVLYLLVPNTNNPELSHPAGWRVAEKGVRPREEAQGAAPKPRLPSHPCACEKLQAIDSSFLPATGQDFTEAK